MKENNNRTSDDIQSSFEDTDFTSDNTNIDYSNLTVRANELDSIYRGVREYIESQHIEKYVKIRRKNIRYIESNVANKLMYFLFEKYKDDKYVSKVCIFSAVTDIIDVEPTAFLWSLNDKFILELHESLEENLGYKVNMNINKKQLGRLNQSQVEI